MWQGNSAFILQKYVSNLGTWTDLQFAQDINNVGQIVGYGVNAGSTHSVLLTPVADTPGVPEPSTWLLIASALAARLRKRAS